MPHTATATLAAKHARLADSSQAQADALAHLLRLIDTDPALAPLRGGSGIVDRITADRDDMDDDADHNRGVALNLGYVPE